MTGGRGRLVAWCLAVVAVAGGQAAERPALPDLGRKVKMRILVDKVMQPTRGWKTEEWMVKEAAEAGFNVFSPRRGYEDLQAVAQVTEWCRQHGLYHQPWMRGVQDVPKDPALSEGKRVVWANGVEQAIWSPNSDELWAWMASHIVPYAQLSARDDTLMGVFLDYENYWPGKMGNLYELSYDDVILGKFAASKGVALPKLGLKERQPWLDQQGLHDEFRTFQIAWWRQKCRELRQAVDRHNPRFMFNIYPAPGTMFMLEACYPEWATKAAPLILADPWTYGRPGRHTSHDMAIKGNQQILERGLREAREKGINRIYLGGIDPVVTGADPEFCGKNAVLLSGLSDGYWVFYEGPVYNQDHPAYFKWFTWANRRIEAADFAAARQPRETEDPWGAPRVAVSGTVLKRSTRRDYPLIKLRGANALLVSAQQGREVTINVQTYRIGKTELPLVWTVKGPHWEDLRKGEVSVASRGAIQFTPPADGIFVLTLEAGGTAYAVKDSTAPLAIYAEGGARFIDGVAKLYFPVPAELPAFWLSGRGGGGVELLRLRVFNPQGTEAAMGQATLKQNDLQVTVKVGDGGGKAWALTIEKADEGVLEDSSLTLDAKLPQALSYFADEVFEIQRRKL